MLAVNCEREKRKRRCAVVNAVLILLKNLVKMGLGVSERQKQLAYLRPTVLPRVRIAQLQANPGGVCCGVECCACPTVSSSICRKERCCITDAIPHVDVCACENLDDCGDNPCDGECKHSASKSSPKTPRNAWKLLRRRRRRSISMPASNSVGTSLL